MRERKRKHDDAHFPLQGAGKRAVRHSGVFKPPNLILSSPTRAEHISALREFFAKEISKLTGGNK